MQSKKKTCQYNDDLTKPVLPQVGWFAAKASRQNILQQLKRGTLFHFRKNIEESPPNAQSQYYQEKQWINDIQIGIEDEDQYIDDAFNNEQTEVQSPKGLPTIAKKQKTTTKYKLKAKLSPRCSKLVCLQKKLKAVGAWNQQNVNCIDKNITRLGLHLNKRKQTLTGNDFKRIQGLSFKDQSFQESISSIGRDLSFYTSNPFSNLALANSTTGFHDHHNRSRLRQLKSIKQKKESEGHFIPSFLLDSIIVSNHKSRII